jgi:hypothetical protein
MRVFWLLKERIALDARFDQVEIGDPNFFNSSAASSGLLSDIALNCELGPNRAPTRSAPHTETTDAVTCSK